MLTKSEKEQLTFAVDEIRHVSIYEKQHTKSSEEITNTFLDAILDLKRMLKDKTQKLDHINDLLEGVSWYKDLGPDDLILLNDLIAAAKDLRSTLIKQYINLNTLKNKGIAKHEISLFKQSIDDLRETYTDIESIFFYLPQNKEFQKAVKEIETLK